MKRLLLLASLLALTASTAEALPAFNGAIGFGAASYGGSGRHNGSNPTIYKVTNLNDSGAGSLRACAEASGVRVCVFETSGEIQLTSSLVVDNSYLTIAGQSAPSPGIVVTGCGLRLRASHLILRHFAIRPGDSPTPNTGTCAPNSRDALAIVADVRNVANVMIDHISLSSSLDEVLSSYTANGYTIAGLSFQEIAAFKPLNASIHDEGAGYENHGLGPLVDDNSQVTFVLSIVADALDRNIRAKTKSYIEFVNNYVYNWGGTSNGNVFNFSDTAIGGAFLNIVGNVFQRGPNSPTSGATVYALYVASGQIDTATRVFMSHNICANRTSDTGDEWLCVHPNIPSSPHRVNVEAFTGSGITSIAPALVKAYVSAYAGSRPFERNREDQEMIDEIANNTGKIVDCVTSVSPRDGSFCANNMGGAPSYAVNTRTLAPPGPGDGDSDGWTDLDEYLDAFASNVTFGPPIGGLLTKTKPRGGRARR